MVWEERNQEDKRNQGTFYEIEGWQEFKGWLDTASSIVCIVVVITGLQ
jgi:hypothetical protein